jgi:hypothetical protein
MILDLTSSMRCMEGQGMYKVERKGDERENYMEGEEGSKDERERRCIFS